MGPFNLRRNTALAACALPILGVIGGLAACRPSEAREPAVLAVSGPRTHPADELALAARLPDDCLIYLATHSVEGFFEAVGRDAIARRFAEPWERAVFEIVRETGVDPLSLGGLEEMGVDVTGELSFAVLPGRDPVVAVGVALTDPDRFKVALYRAMPRGRHRPRVVGEAILVGDDDATVIIEGRMALVVVGDDADRHAAALAVRDPEASLARHRPFRVAMRQLKSAPLVRGWLDPRGLTYVASGLDPRWAGASFGAAMDDIASASRRALEAARERGASAEELVAIDEHYAMAQQELRGDEEATRLRRLIGGVDGAGLALDISEDGLVARLKIDADDGALLRRVWRNRPGVPGVVGALDRAPLFVVALSLEPDALLEGLPLLGLGGEVQGALEALSAGVPIGDLLSGEVELVVGHPSDEAFTASLEELRAGAVVGVVDPPRVRALLDELSGREGGPLARREEGWRLALPDLPALDVTLVDERLVLATDATIGERLVGDDRGSFEPTRALSLVDRSGDALSFAFAAGLPIAATTRGMAMWSSSSSTGWHDEAVPRSPAYDEKKTQLEAMDRRLGEQMLAVQREERERVMAMVSSLGHVATRLRTVDHGLEIELRYQTAEGALVDAIADVAHVERGIGGQQARRLEMMWAERGVLEAELNAIYERDRAAAAKAPRRPAEKPAPTKPAPKKP